MPAHRHRRTHVTGCAAAVVAGLALSTAPTPPAHAHGTAVGYGRISQSGADVEWTLWLDPYHLNSFMSLDADQDAEVEPRELAARAEEIEALVVPEIAVRDRSDDTVLPDVRAGKVRMVTMADTTLTGEGFTELAEFPLVELPVRFAFPDEVEPEDLEFRYDLFLEHGFEDHWNTARFEIGGERHTVRFEPDASNVSLGSIRDGGEASAAPGDDGSPIAAVALGGGVLAVATAAVVLALRRKAAARR